MASEYILESFTGPCICLVSILANDNLSRVFVQNNMWDLLQTDFSDVNSHSMTVYLVQKKAKIVKMAPSDIESTVVKLYIIWVNIISFDLL